MQEPRLAAITEVLMAMAIDLPLRVSGRGAPPTLLKWVKELWEPRLGAMRWWYTAYR